MIKITCNHNTNYTLFFEKKKLLLTDKTNRTIFGVVNVSVHWQFLNFSAIMSVYPLPSLIDTLLPN